MCLLWGWRRCVVGPSRGPKVTCCVTQQGDPHSCSTCRIGLSWNGHVYHGIVIDRSCGPLLLPRHMDRVSGVLLSLSSCPFHCSLYCPLLCPRKRRSHCQPNARARASLLTVLIQHDALMFWLALFTLVVQKDWKVVLDRHLRRTMT